MLQAYLGPQQSCCEYRKTMRGEIRRLPSYFVRSRRPSNPSTPHTKVLQSSRSRLYHPLHECNMYLVRELPTRRRRRLVITFVPCPSFLRRVLTVSDRHSSREAIATLRVCQLSSVVRFSTSRGSVFSQPVKPVSPTCLGTMSRP